LISCLSEGKSWTWKGGDGGKRSRQSRKGAEAAVKGKCKGRAQEGTEGAERALRVQGETAHYLPAYKYVTLMFMKDQGRRDEGLMANCAERARWVPGCTLQGGERERKRAAFWEALRAEKRGNRVDKRGKGENGKGL